MFRKLDRWMALSDVDRDALLALPYTLRAIDPGMSVVREGDRNEVVTLLRSGYAARHKAVGDGARQILSIHLRGDFVDLQNTMIGIADHGVMALSRCDVASIPRDAMRALAFARPAIGEALWYDTLVDAATFREWIANIGRRDARTRVAHLLCEFAVRMQSAGLGAHDRYDLPLTQEQIADCTGLTPVHVNRMLMILSEEQLISRSKRALTINDWHKLVAAGDFDDRYLHLDDMRSAGAGRSRPASQAQPSST